MTNFDDAERERLTERMRAARGKGVVALQSYNTLRSKVPGKVILALEGDDDPIYFGTTIRKIDDSFSWTPLVCNGKDKVLSLRVLLERNMDPDAKKTFFIVDCDFDDLKGHEPGPDIYCTPGYSFENSIVSEEVLVELLHGEYKCTPMSDEVTGIVSTYRLRKDEFISSIELANRALHFCRTTGRRSGSVENNIGKYVRISLDSVVSKYSHDDLGRLVGLPNDANYADFTLTETAFNSLDPMRDWRGKYIIAFFVEFLRCLQEDRSSQNPSAFDSRRAISFNPKSSIIRVLSSIAEPPECLKEFVQRIAA